MSPNAARPPLQPSAMHPALRALRSQLAVAADTPIDKFEFAEWLHKNQQTLAFRFYQSAWPVGDFETWARLQFQADSRAASAKPV